MRVISGKFKGHRLASFDEGHIRPMTDRVKESIFNILSPYIDGARVLDLFSGTGSVGIEALSRGASFIQFVEKDPRSIKVIVDNLEKLRVEDGVDIKKSDVLAFLTRYHGPAFQIILIDPPFKAMLGQKTLEALATSQAIDGDSQIMIEHSSQEVLQAEINSLERLDQREYGDKFVSFYRLKV